MPRGDRTGPRGMGSMTGRAAGYCAGFGMPGYANPSPHLGFGAGFGRGRGMGAGGFGWRNRFYAAGVPGWMPPAGYPEPYRQPDPEWEKQSLKSQADALESELDAIKKRLDELETSPQKT